MNLAIIAVLEKYYLAAQNTAVYRHRQWRGTDESWLFANNRL